MVKIDHFRGFILYERSLDLTKLIYEISYKFEEDLTDGEVRLIRKHAGSIPNQIASAITQINMKVRFKKLNEAVATLMQLKVVVQNLKTRKKINYQSWQIFEKYRIEVIKLLNGYFGWIGSKK